MAVEESQVYRDLMRLKPEEWTANAWAVKAGVSRTVWADMRRHGNPSRRTLEKLLEAAGSSLAEFEALRLGDGRRRGEAHRHGQVGEGPTAEWTGASLPPIPLYATAAGGEWDGRAGAELTELHPHRLMAQLARPVSLAGDRGTYALTIVGDSMWPRFRPGRLIAVSPQTAIAPGDDVAVHIKAEAPAGTGQPTIILIKELVDRAEGHVELRQFNPGISFRIDSDRIEAIHKVMGELI